MTINEIKQGSALKLMVEGRIDTTTSPELEKHLSANLNGISELVIDFAGVEYISSSGLRVLLSAQKVMNKQGTMKLIHVSDLVNEVFEVTGFSEILTIE